MIKIGLVLYPQFTALDIVGPFQTLVDVPGLDVFFVAESVGPVTDHTGRLVLNATHAFSDIEALDVVVVPGGFADREIDANNAVVQFVKRTPNNTVDYECLYRFNLPRTRGHIERTCCNDTLGFV